ncbi:MAG: spore coat protein CotJB [Lachnospiraceae bacterium]|nr:spore coat protein CotJB [Lachnospiraceae bacterium]
MGEIRRQELVNHIGKISFSMDDLRIFLDTHPNCSEALVRFNELAKKRDEHIHKFEKLYGSMDFYNNNVCDEHWRWVDAPWPWEGEC